MEEAIAHQIESANLPVIYEETTLDYIWPARPSKYTPDFQVGDIGRLNKARNTLCFAPFALLSIKATVQYRNTAISVKPIVCRNLIEASLKTVIKPGNFVPLT